MVRLLSMAIVALSTLSASVSAFAPTSSFFGSSAVAQSVAEPARAPVRESMSMRARECDLTGKRANRQCMAVSFSHKRTKKMQGVNLQKKRLWSEELNKFISMRISTKVLHFCRLPGKATLTTIYSGYINALLLACCFVHRAASHLVYGKEGVGGC